MSSRRQRTTCTLHLTRTNRVSLLDMTAEFYSVANHDTVFKKPPFRIDEKGWGEFDMTIVLTAIGKGGDHTLEHDLNFQQERYEAKHQVVSARYSPPNAIRINKV